MQHERPSQMSRESSEPVWNQPTHVRRGHEKCGGMRMRKVLKGPDIDCHKK